MNDATADGPRRHRGKNDAMLKDQICIADSAEEIQASVEQGYREGLY